MTSVIIVITALTFDALLGEARRWHPLVGFGQWAKLLERKLYASARRAGALALLLAVSPFVLAAFALQQSDYAPLYTAVLLYLALGWRSLGQHTLPIATALRAGDIDGARRRLSYIVSRDTADIDEQGIAKATVESVLENGSDAIFAAIFWAVVAGAPGVVLYRLANTLDAMWGYKNERYLQFGWAAARLDDVLNYIPARLTALSYALLGNCKLALRCWRRQGDGWKSPNAGPVMASGAGSLGLLLGGSAQYHGEMQHRPPLGEGKQAETVDIERSMSLINRVVLLWVALLFAAAAIAAPPF